MRSHWKHVLLAVLLWLGALIVARGFTPTPALGASGQNGYPPGTTGIVAIGYYPDAQNTQPWRGPLTVADTTTLSAANLAGFTVANGGRVKTLGRPNQSLSVRFTGGEGTTCAVAFVAIYVNPATPTVDRVLGVADVTTITATQFTDPDGRNIGFTQLSDGYGSTDGIWLLVSAPSAGAVYFDPGTY